jgi:RNA polymerase sigma-70 factor (ECF subfamily)
MDDPHLAELFARVRAGDEAAASDLLRRFEPEVRMVVRGKLPRALRTQFDSMDFVQAVWTSVLTREGPDPARFSSARHFMGFLAGVARNKVYEAYRRRTTRKYDLGREEPLYVRRGNREVPRELAASDPTPSKAPQAEERLDQMLEGRSPLEQRMILLRRRGLTFEEIAEELGVHESRVRRLVESVRERLEARGWR